MNTIVEFQRSLGNELIEDFHALQQFVTDSVEQHRRIDQVEHGVFELLLQLGFRLLQEFVLKSGDGDQGEMLVRDGRVLKRMKRSRPYRRSIFGVLEIVRFVYALGKRRKV
jgi:hypothetical protein